jgi:hypothetical protein
MAGRVSDGRLGCGTGGVAVAAWATSFATVVGTGDGLVDVTAGVVVEIGAAASRERVERNVVPPAWLRTALLAAAPETPNIPVAAATASPAAKVTAVTAWRTVRGLTRRTDDSTRDRGRNGFVRHYTPDGKTPDTDRSKTGTPISAVGEASTSSGSPSRRKR